MSCKSMEVPLPMTTSRGQKQFICRLVEGCDKKVFLKIPSTFAATFALLNLDIIGLHLPIKKTWLGRFVRTSETVQGIDSLMSYFNVKPCYVFVLKYIGGTEFQVEIFNEYAVEIDYLGKGTTFPKRAVFDMSEFEKDKLFCTLSYNAGSSMHGEIEIVVNPKHLEGENMTEVLSKQQVLEMGLNPEIEWVDVGFKSVVYRMMLHWEENAVFADKEWANFTKACQLQVGDTCILMNTPKEQKFEVAIIAKDKSKEIFRSGSVEGKSLLKWFHTLNYITVHTGELDVPYVFAANYSSAICDNAKIYLAHGMVFRSYFSKTAKMLFGIKNLMENYEIKENWTIFFDYIGDSKFYASIYNEEGMDILNDLPQKLVLTTVMEHVATSGIVMSNDHEQEDIVNVEAEPKYNFTVTLLRSHVDQKGHGVFLPRHLHELYKKWNRSTTVNLIMESRSYKLAILRRNKTCRLGIGWNEFTLKNTLRVDQRLLFTYKGNSTFEVTEIV